jgi:hypothetical protein
MQAPRAVSLLALVAALLAARADASIGDRDLRFIHCRAVRARASA